MANVHKWPFSRKLLSDRKLDTCIVINKNEITKTVAYVQYLTICSGTSKLKNGHDQMIRQQLQWIMRNPCVYKQKEHIDELLCLCDILSSVIYNLKTIKDTFISIFDVLYLACPAIGHANSMLMLTFNC